MRQTLKTTTALIASLSLIVPAPVLAQETANMVCADGSPQPCPEGVELIPAPAPEAPAAEAPAEEPAADQPADAAPAAEPAPAAPAEEPASEAPAAEPAAEPETAVEPAPEPEAVAPAKEPAAEPAPEVTIEPAPAPGTAVEPAPETAVEPTPEALPAEPAPEAAPEPAPAEVAPEPAPAEAAPGGTVTEPEAATPEPTAEPAAPAAAAEPAAEPEAAPAAEPAPAETAPAEEAAPAEAAPETPAADTGAEPAATPTEEDLQKALEAEQGAAEGTAEPATGEGTAPAPAETVVIDEAPMEAPDMPAQPDAAGGEAPVAAAASAPEATEATDAQIPVVEQTITEESARSSAEDFTTKVNETAPATATTAAVAAAKKKDRLSDAEKIALFGLGALAIGAILSNNRKVEQNSGDRVVVMRDDGSYQIIKDDDALLRQPGSTVRTETFNDGSTRTIVTRTDGTQIVTIRDAEMRVLRRVHVARDGTQTLLIDDTAGAEPVVVSELPRPARRIDIAPSSASEAELRAALRRESDVGRRFSLAQVRDIYEVRALMPVIDLDAITFETGSSAIRPDQARALSALGRTIQDMITEDPREMFLIEGHTDAVGGAAYNLALSDRRAESVALALTEYFGVPPENMVVQGYGEEFLKIDTQGDERQNRRASVRRITDLLVQ